MAVDFLCHFILREIFVWSCLGLIIIGRNQYEGENNVYAGFSISLLYCLLYESVIYTNHRSKAILFMQMKQTAL